MALHGSAIASRIGSGAGMPSSGIQAACQWSAAADNTFPLILNFATVHCMGDLHDELWIFSGMQMPWNLISHLV